ncbi:MAG: ABC transporter ATP-binding protein [Clostridia bacterium]|nr:ABC transporter ATP-binding protein [Clostridia bacterium]
MSAILETKNLPQDYRPVVILEAKNLTKNYGPTVGLSNFSISLEGGKIIGLLGSNGSGKTTLLKMIAGILQPTSGIVTVNGLTIGTETKKIVSYLPERTYLNSWMRIRDILDYFEDFYADFDKAAAMRMLASLSVNENEKLKNLSKGTREKVQLVLVMSRKAKVYLLDEPIAGVDPVAREFILETILSNRAPDSTILISTHLIADVEKVLDSFIFIRDGQLLMAKDVASVRESGKTVDELFREVYRCL